MRLFAIFIFLSVLLCVASAIFTEDAILTASDQIGFSGFGASVALNDNGTSAVMGAHSADDAGAAYVFEKNTGIWVQVAKITASDESPEMNFGSSVAMSADGNSLVVGANCAYVSFECQGAVYVFEKISDTWTEMAKLAASDGTENNYFGDAVSMNGNGTSLVVGSHTQEAAYIFEKITDTWTEMAKLAASDGGMYNDFGGAVSMNGNGTSVVVGANNVQPLGLGAAYVFEKINGSWTEVAKLTPSDEYYGNDFGIAVAMNTDGNSLVVGDSSYQNITGAAYVFENDNGNWTEVVKLTASDGTDNDYFGGAVAMNGDGTSVVVGSSFDGETYYEEGAAYVFEISGTWTQVAKLTASDGNDFEEFGSSVAMSEDGISVLVGSYGGNAAYIFSSLEPSPSPSATSSNSPTQSRTRSVSVSLSSSTTQSYTSLSSGTQLPSFSPSSSPAPSSSSTPSASVTPSSSREATVSRTRGSYVQLLFACSTGRGRDWWGCCEDFTGDWSSIVLSNVNRLVAMRFCQGLTNFSSKEGVRTLPGGHDLRLSSEEDTVTVYVEFEQYGSETHSSEEILAEYATLFGCDDFVLEECSTADPNVLPSDWAYVSWEVVPEDNDRSSSRGSSNDDSSTGDSSGSQDGGGFSSVSFALLLIPFLFGAFPLF